MKSSNTVKTWTTTRVQGLMRHKSGRYYARLFSGGKEKWVSLKTTLFEIAKARLGSDEAVVELRQGKAAKGKALTGKMTVGEAVDLYKANLENRINLKASTRQFWIWNLDWILNTWPEILSIDIRKVTENDCKRWAAKNAPFVSASYFNNSLVNLNRIFQVGVDAGVIHRNPAKGLERKREKKPTIALPSRAQFVSFVASVRAMKHRTSEDAADLVELLAYTGCRISEAKVLAWGDVDFEKGEIFLKGDPVTGTKNWESRRIPILPDCLDLLNRIRLKRPNEALVEPIAQLGDIRESMAKASDSIGFTKITHHHLRHLFATICIESGVDIPTVSRWLGHKDGGALAMRTYGHLRREHSIAQAEKVRFMIK